MIDSERIMAIINCNQWWMRIITQGKEKKAETWLSSVLMDGEVISWLLMTDFSTVSTQALIPVGRRRKKWPHYNDATDLTLPSLVWIELVPVPLSVLTFFPVTAVIASGGEGTAGRYLTDTRESYGVENTPILWLWVITSRYHNIAGC